MIGIYKITNPKNKIYIGQSKNIEERWRGYKRLKEKNGQRKLYFSFQKYGYENHKFEVLEEYLLEQLHEREIYWKNKILKEKNNNWNQVLFLQVDDRGDFTNKWKINRLKSIRKTLLQYDMDGNFIKEWISAAEAIKSFEKGNANNINDAARGKYNSTYNYQWRYKQGKRHKHNIGPCPKNPTTSGTTWTEERRIQYKKARKGEKRSKEYSEKISKLKQKSVYQFDQNNKLISIFPSFSYFNKDSGIIGTTKLRKIINKNIYYNEYRYSYTL